jgi:uncharacterized protein YjbI with pentapeptide repeats
MGVEMKSFLAMASMLLFVLAAQGFGFAFGEEPATANDSINETLKNTTLINGTFENATLINGTFENATLINGTFENVTLTNETLENVTLAQSDLNPFENAKNRKPKSR